MIPVLAAVDGAAKGGREGLNLARGPPDGNPRCASSCNGAGMRPAATVVAPVGPVGWGL